MDTSHWQHFHHGADIGVRGTGSTLEDAFAQAAVAMTAVICDPKSVHAKTGVPILAEAPNPELLLTDWLNAIILAMATKRMLFSRFELRIEDNRLSGTAYGEPIDRARHQPAVEVKGATYTELRVCRQDGGWLAQCVVDV